ncbi:hypothetical protein SMC26_11860 [Actinomadura fulvescens]|uniref:Uncharacterized protein n=1 Tax=Actinomadura fulvescens TaxID=46160 RepID=A0ABN3PHJ6_9ACTN
MTHLPPRSSRPAAFIIAGILLAGVIGSAQAPAPPCPPPPATQDGGLQFN